MRRTYLEGVPVPNLVRFIDRGFVWDREMASKGIGLTPLRSQVPTLDPLLPGPAAVPVLGMDSIRPP